jgi:hypothetical protein
MSNCGAPAGFPDAVDMVALLNRINDGFGSCQNGQTSHLKLWLVRRTLQKPDTRKACFWVRSAPSVWRAEQPHWAQQSALFSATRRQLERIGGMTTRKHEQISKTSKPTAARDLIDLEQHGLLVKKGMGRSTRYYPAIDGWAEEPR